MFVCLFWCLQIKAFHKQRVGEMRSCVTQLARAELARARSIRQALGRSLQLVHLFPVPSDADSSDSAASPSSSTPLQRYH